MLTEVRPICDCLNAAIRFWQESPESIYARTTVVSLQKMVAFLTKTTKRKAIMPNHRQDLRNMLNQLQTIVSTNSIFRKNHPSPETVAKIEEIDGLLEEAEEAVAGLNVKIKPGNQ
jgi:hypothetical protein